MIREETLIDRTITPALKHIAKQRAYFRRQEVVHEVLRRRGLADAVKDVRRSFTGFGFDVVIVRYIEECVSRSLQARDANGIRIYECYSAGNGERRWVRFRSMKAADLAAVLSDLRALRDQVAAKVKFYELVQSELQRRGAEADVDSVYDVIAKRRTIVRAAARADLERAS